MKKEKKSSVKMASTEVVKTPIPFGEIQNDMDPMTKPAKGKMENGKR